MTPPKPPRDDERTPPSGVRRVIETPVRGLPVGRITERGPAQLADRDRYTPRRPEDWDEDSTPPTTDPALYRAIRSLKSDMKEQADEVGGLSTQVALLHAGAIETKAAIKEINGKQDQQSTQLSTISGQLGMIIDDRHQMLRVTETRMLAQSTTKETLADGILAEQRAGNAFKRRALLKIISGLFSSAVLGALVALLASRC